MGGVYSCPEGYEMLRQSVYKSSVRLCLQKQMIENNRTVITDISNPVESSGAYQAQFPIEAVVCLLCGILLLLRN